MTRDTKRLEKLSLSKLKQPFQAMIDKISNYAKHCLDLMTTEKGTMLIAILGLVVGIASLQGWVSVIFGSIALGLLAGQAMRPILQTSSNFTETVEKEKIVPYDEWPSECYACSRELGEVRGQLVIHKGESTDRLKAVGLCENCTRTHSTMLDYSDRFAEIYDMRGEPEEL